MDIKLLTWESLENKKPNSIGSSRIRGRWLIKYWDEASEYTIGDNPDVMIYQKAYWKEHLQDFKGLKIFDLCDPDWLDGRPVKETAQYVDAFVVPTQALKDSMVQFIDKPIFVIPDRFDLEEFQVTKENHSGEAQKAVWYGYVANSYVLKMVGSYLRKHKIKLTAISNENVMEADYNIPFDWNTFHDEIIANDFVLLPNGDNNRFKYKSDNKTAEARLLKMPVAKTYDDILRFLDPLERQKEADKYYDDYRKQYDVKNSVKEWKDVISQLLKNKK